MNTDGFKNLTMEEEEDAANQLKVCQEELLRNQNLTLDENGVPLAQYCHPIRNFVNQIEPGRRFGYIAHGNDNPNLKSTLVHLLGQDVFRGVCVLE